MKSVFSSPLVKETLLFLSFFLMLSTSCFILQSCSNDAENPMNMNDDVDADDDADGMDNDMDSTNPDECDYDFMADLDSGFCGFDYETLPHCIDCEDEEGQLGTYNLLIDRPVDAYSETNPLRPHILFMHGLGANVSAAEDPYAGWFLGIFREEFCKYGYGFSTLEYRQDIKGFTIFPSICSTPEEEVIRTHYRAIQDLRKAIDLLYQNPEQYGIDIENVFLMGNSQGGSMILNSVMVEDETEWLSALPAQYQNLDEELGPWAPRHEVKGVVSVAGAIYDLEFIDGTDTTPLYLAHGVCDLQVPYKTGTFLDCPTQVDVHGSYEVACRAEELGIPYSLHSVTGLGHGWTDEVLAQHYLDVRDWMLNQVICGDPLQEDFTIAANEVSCETTSTDPSDCM